MHGGTVILYSKHAVHSERTKVLIATWLSPTLLDKHQIKGGKGYRMGTKLNSCTSPDDAIHT